MACSCDKKKVMNHLKGDIKVYKREANDDRELMKDLKAKKSEKEDSKKHEKRESKKHEKKEDKKEKKIKKVMKKK